MSNKYENIAEFYQICLPDFWIPFTKLLEKKIPNIKYNLLDLGCGTGDAVKYLENYINLYLGIDHSNEMLEIAKKKYPNFEFIKGDIVEYNNTLNIKYDIKQLNKDTISLMINSLTHHNIQRQEQPKFSESINDSVIENMDELLEQQVRQRELDLTISQPKQDFTKEIAELAELRQTVQTLRIELERLKSSSV